MRLDQPNNYYYLIPWQQKESVTAIARVDARFGTFSGIRLLNNPIKAEMLTREKVMKQVSGLRIDLPEMRGRLRFFPETACLSPVLVWRPCWESWSPNLPFYQYTIGENVFYIRLDGKTFTNLTTTGRGT